MRKRLRDISLSKKIPVIFGVLMLLLVWIPCFVMYGYYYSVFSQTVTKSLSSAMGANAGELCNLINTISNGIDIVMDNEDSNILDASSTLSEVADFIVNYEKSDELGHMNDLVNNMTNNQKRFTDLFETILGTTTASPKSCLIVFDEYPVSAYFGRWVGSSSTTFLSCSGLETEQWYQATIAKDGKFHWFNLEDEPGMIFLAKLLKYQDYRKQNYRIRSMGIILIGFNVDWIEERISTSELTEETQIFIAESEGKVVYSNSKSNALTEESVHELLQDTASGESVYREYDRDLYLVQRNELGHGLVMFTLIPASDVAEMTAQMVRIIMIVMLVIIVMSVLLVELLSKHMLKPILRLSAQMETGLVEQIDDDYISKDEVGQLYRGYNQMQRKIQEMIQEVWHSAENQKKSEIRMLQAQINPHFVLNTLASVSSYALMNGQDQLASQLTNLSKLMRYNVRKPEAMVLLGEEIANIRIYEEIQRLNYGDRFTVHYSLAPECEEIFVPKLIIQPLVENSIIHMFTDSGKGEINVVASMQDEQTMVIIVADSGVGVDTERINQYMRGERSFETAKDSIGVRNVYERIRLIYGKHGDLIYRTDRDGHTEAVVTIQVSEKKVE